jgi:hypothetical protein
MAEMLPEIECRIIDQDGIREAEGDRNDPAPQGWELAQASGEVLPHVLQGEGFAGARPEQPEGDDLHRLSGQLHVEEQRIQAAEPARSRFRRRPAANGDTPHLCEGLFGYRLSIPTTSRQIHEL